MKIRFIALLVLGFICIESGAQSLPDVARRERERQREVGDGRIFTNENVATGGSIRTSESGTGLPSEAPPTVTTPTEESATEQTEEEWRQMFSQARDELTRSEERLILIEQELVDLNQRLLTESSLFDRENQLGPQIQAKRDELTQGEARVEAANQAIADLQQELRRAGAPPGWGRP